MAVYICGAGVHHHERASVVERWRRADAERAAGRVADKVRAHDDYRDAITLFRQRMVERIQEDTEFTRGYRAALKDLEGAIVDVLRRRQDEEETS